MALPHPSSDDIPAQEVGWQERRKQDTSEVDRNPDEGLRRPEEGQGWFFFILVLKLLWRQTWRQQKYKKACPGHVEQVPQEGHMWWSRERERNYAPIPLIPTGWPGASARLTFLVCKMYLKRVGRACRKHRGGVQWVWFPFPSDLRRCSFLETQVKCNHVFQHIW